MSQCYMQLWVLIGTLKEDDSIWLPPRQHTMHETSENVLQACTVAHNLVTI